MDGQHHLHLRERLHKRFEAYPNPDALKRFLDRVMYLVSVGVPLALVPQVVRIYETQNVADLSLITWLLLGCFNVLWAVYGLVHRSYPVLISSAACALLHFTMVLAIVLYQ